MEALQGYRIVSLALNIPGPVALARLCSLGAEVVKIEPPDGDALALASPSWYRVLHENVEVHRLDLKEAGARRQLAAQLNQSDLLLTASRPSSLERLNLGWSSLAARYPDLCQVAIVGYPPPDEERPGHDLTYQAALGLLEPPALPRALLADLAGADRAVSSVLALLLGRENARLAGRKQSADERYCRVSLADAGAAFAAPLRYHLTGPDSLLGGLLPSYNLYRTRDGWIAVAALERHFLQRLAEELGLKDVSKETLSEAFQTRTAGEWEEWAMRRDLPLAAVRESPVR